MESSSKKLIFGLIGLLFIFFPQMGTSQIIGGGGGGGIPSVTVSHLPPAANALNAPYIVTDGASTGDCSIGSGSTRVICISNGTSWTAPVTGAGGGQVNSVVGTTDKITIDSSDPTAPVATIAATYAGQTSIVTLGTVTTGTWHGTAIGDSYISSAATWSGKQAAHTNLESIGTLADGAGWLHDNGAGTFAYSTPSKSDVGLGSVENTALSTWAGTTNITTLGTIGTGVWHGSAVADSYISSASTWNAAAPKASPTFTGTVTMPTATNVVPALVLPSGSLLSTTAAGTFENNGTHLYFTFADSGTRYQLDQQSAAGANSSLSNLGTTSINASLIAAATTSDLGTGAAPWGSLFLKSTGVINFANGNCTVTHATGLLSIKSGCVLKTGGDTTIRGRLSESIEVTTLSDYGGISLTSFNSSAVGVDASPLVEYQRSRGSTVGAMNAVVSGDSLGQFTFRGADGTNFVSAGGFKGQVDGSVSSGTVPGRLVFLTMTAAGSLTEKMRIDSAGNVGIGVTPSYQVSASTDYALQGANGQAGRWKRDFETISVGSGVSSVNGTAAKIPADSIIHFIGIRSKVQPGGTTTMVVTASVSGTVFQQGASMSTVAGTVDKGGRAYGTNYAGVADQTVTITFDAPTNDTAGRIEIEYEYEVPVGMTS